MFVSYTLAKLAWLDFATVVTGSTDGRWLITINRIESVVVLVCISRHNQAK